MNDSVLCPNCGAAVATYRNPLPTADIVAIRNNEVLLIRRRNPPEGWALPGGFVEYGETAEAAAIRELREETGLLATNLRLVGVYSDPNRDRRFHTFGVAYAADTSGEIVPGDDASEARWFPLEQLPKPIAFDHRLIIADAIGR
ncbi:MAG: NUDIX hydrolase [Calditrichaeota bacterium]|nr:NUDIX hydrolase [Calditrichota bacterium]MCB9368051.1 NUDIX hydrolase [Calditrichota bacterium]